MRDILIEQGVPEEKLILEDQAATTKENFAYLAAMEGFSCENLKVMFASCS